MAPPALDSTPSALPRPARGVFRPADATVLRLWPVLHPPVSVLKATVQNGATSMCRFAFSRKTEEAERQTVPLGRPCLFSD